MLKRKDRISSLKNKDCCNGYQTKKLQGFLRSLFEENLVHSLSSIVNRVANNQYIGDAETSSA
jgi:hypothetical protein